MTNKNKFKRGLLSGSTALSALAVVGGFAASAVVATPAFAQDYTTGVIVGAVQNPEGVAVTSGTATVVSNDQGFTRTVAIGTDGTFRVPSLPTGTYTVTITAPGFQTVADPNVAVAAGTSNTWVFTVGAAGATSTADAAGGSGSEIVVIGRAIRANDFAQTTTGLLVDVDELTQTVPVARNQTALILLAPGTTAGDTGFGNFASIGGATVAENSYYVNGLNTTDFRNFLGSSIVPFEFYESLDVQTGGYQAEFGRAMGGFVNATTERGTNEFRGGAILTYNPNVGANDAPNTYAAFNELDYRESGDATLFLSGPLIRDRVFFYGFYNPRFLRNEDTSISAQQRVVTTARTPFWGGKLDVILAEGHRLEGTLFSDKQTQRTDYYTTRGDITGVLGGSVANQGQSDYELNGGYLGRAINGFGGLNYIGTYTGAFTDWFTLSASYGKNKNRGTQTASPNVPFVQSQLTGATTTASGGAQSILGDQDTREIYRVDADLYLNNFLGDHHFRGGYDVENLTAVEDTRRTGTPKDGSDVSCSYVLQAARPYASCYLNQGTFRTKMSSYYLQDSWSLLDERLTLNLGIRNDNFKNRTVAGDVYFESKNNWGPRVGATFDVFGDRRTRLQAFWGRYYLPVATNTNLRLGGEELFYTQFLEYAPGTLASGWNDVGLPNSFPLDANGTPIFGPSARNNVSSGGAGGVPCPAVSPDAGEMCRTISSDGVLGPTDTLINADLQPSFSDEMILGLTHRMGDWTAGIQYINRRLGQTLDDVAIDAAVNAYCEREGIVGCDTVWTGFHQYVLTNPGTDMSVRLDGTRLCNGTVNATDPSLDPVDDERACDVVELSAEDLGYPKATRKYDSIQLSLNRRWDDVWSFNGSYTWTKLRGNYEGAVTTDENQADAGLTQDFDQPGFLEGRTGSLPNERRHQFKAYGAFQATPWMRVGLNAQLASPRSFSCFGNYVPEGGGYAFEADYGAASQWCTQSRFAGNPSRVSNGDGYLPAGTVSYLVPRGAAFKSDWLKQVDLGLAFVIPGLENSDFRIDVFNVFNWASKLDFQEFGDLDFAGANPRYGQVTGFQAPRSVRFTLGLRFGPGFHTEDEGEESVTQGR